MHSEFANAFEDVLRRIWRKIGDQLVVDGQIRRQHKKVADALCLIQISDKCPHETSLSNAGGNRKAQGREVPLKVLNCGKLALNRRQSRSRIGFLRQVDDLADPSQDFKRVPLWRAQTQAIADGIDVLNAHVETPD